MKIAGDRQVGGGHGRVRQEGPVDVTERERQRDADGRDREGRGADPEHFLEVGLEPDLEQQEEHAELGEDVHQLGGRPLGRDDAEHAPAQQHAGDELAQHRRLSDALRRSAQNLGGDQHRGEKEEEAGDIHPAFGRQEGYGGQRDERDSRAGPPREAAARTCDGRKATRHALRTQFGW